MKDIFRYLDEIVEPTIADFEANPTSVRHAFLACVVTFHGVDYLAYPRPSATLRQVFRRQSEDFKLIDNITHAFKHVIAGKRSSPELRSADVIARAPAILGSFMLGISRIGDAIGGVTLDGQPALDLLPIVKRVAKFLRSKARS